MYGNADRVLYQQTRTIQTAKIRRFDWAIETTKDKDWDTFTFILS